MGQTAIREARGRRAALFAVANYKRFIRTQNDTCFRTRLIEELDVLCRLAAKYKQFC